MGAKRMKARVGVALIGIGAMTAASILPGALAMAEETGGVPSAVTRAVLSQGDANGEISRSTLITQIQVDGKGQTSFTIPAPYGATPKDMDAFGGPPVEDGVATYNLDVDGPELLRTSQTYNTDDLPVTVEVSATLNGESIEPSELAGKDGLAALTYTLTNLTSEPTEITYTDAAGDEVTKTEEIPTPMAGSLSFVFDSSWTAVTSAESDTVAQNGSGGTTVGATVSLMAPPAGETQASVTIEGRVEGAVVPPADIKVAIIDPLTTGAGQSGEALAKQTGEGLTTLYADGLEPLGSGLEELSSGLGEAVAGAGQIADGVAGTLAPGVAQLSDGLGALDTGANRLADGVTNTLAPGANRLNDGIQGQVVPGMETLITELADLPSTVRGQAGFKKILDGFDGLNAAVGGVKDGLGVFSSSGPGQYLKANGNIDKSKTTAARTLWSLTYGVRSKDVPSGSPTNVPSEATGGLSNPECSLAKPKDPKNPCGAWQIVKGVSLGLNGGIPGTGKPGAVQALGLIKDGLDNQAIPGLDQLTAGLDLAKGGIAQVRAGLTGTSAGLEGPIAGAFTGLAGLLGCSTTPGAGGPIVDAGGCPAGSFTGGAPVAGGVAAYLNGITEGLYKAPVSQTDMGIKSFQDAFNAGLGQVDGGLDQLKGGVAQIKTGLQTASGGIGQVSGGIQVAAGGLDELLKVITSKANGVPDADTTNGNTATGILSELRRNLALGGAGTSGAPGKCEGYNTPGDPKSGLNKNATPDQLRSTCAAADVLNFSLLVSAGLETGVSVTLLDDISEGLVTKTQPLVDGVVNEVGPGMQDLTSGINDSVLPGTQALAEGLGLADAGGQELNEGVSGSSPTSLVNGTRTLAEGLPAAEAGALTAANGVTQQMMPGVNSSVETANESIAVLQALSQRADTYANIPGGAAEGVDSNQGIYAFEFAGAGTAAESSAARFGLALLLLLLAGGLGWFLSSRKA